jgi:hypothetical protein
LPLDASQAILGLVDDRSHLIGRGNVCGQDHRRDAGFFGQCLCGSVRFIGVACDDGDPGSGLRQATSPHDAGWKSISPHVLSGLTAFRDDEIRMTRSNPNVLHG